MQRIQIDTSDAEWHGIAADDARRQYEARNILEQVGVLSAGIDPAKDTARRTQMNVPPSAALRLVKL
jgi:hypothetical protein